MRIRLLNVAIDNAWRFWYMGLSVIPVHYGGKNAKYRWTQYQTKQPSENELARWEKMPSNFAVITGPSPIGESFPGLVVIDFDKMPDYELWREWTQGIRPDLAEGYQVKTRRGVHVYLLTRNAAGIRNLHYGGVDVKGAGGYVMLAGSLHPTGFVYSDLDPENGYFPEFEELEEVLPPEILDRYVEAIYQGESGAPLHTEQLIDSVLNKPAGGGGGGVSVEEIKQRRKIQEFIKPERWTGDGYYTAKCPFHDDKVASFWVDTRKEICGCFAGCNGTRPWDVVNLYCRLMGVGNSQALIDLANG